MLSFHWASPLWRLLWIVELLANFWRFLNQTARSNVVRAIHFHALLADSLEFFKVLFEELRLDQKCNKKLARTTIKNYKSTSEAVVNIVVHWSTYKCPLRYHSFLSFKLQVCFLYLKFIAFSVQGGKFFSGLFPTIGRQNSCFHLISFLSPFGFQKGVWVSSVWSKSSNPSELKTKIPLPV